MIRKKILNLLPLFILFILSFIPIFWYETDSIIGGADTSLPLSYDIYLKKGVFAWYENINTGKNMVVRTSKLPEYALMKLISVFNLPANKTEIMYFSLIVFGIVLSFYFFAKQFLDDENGIVKLLTPFFGAVFYFFNFFSITRWEGFDRPIFSIAIAVPLILGLTLRNFKKETWNNYLLIGIASVIFSSAVDNPPSFLTGVLVVILFYLYFIIVSIFRNDLNLLKKYLLIGLKSALVLIGCNLFWYIPMINLGGPKTLFEEFSPIDWLGSMSQTTSFLNVIRLMGAWYWYENSGGSPSAPYAQIYLHNNFFVFLTYLLPFFCLLGMVLSLRKKKAGFLIPILFFGIVFSMGEHPPFGKIYRFLYDHLIFFKPFRSPWFKFSLLITLSYGFFYGFFATAVIGFIKRFSKFFSVILILIFFSFPIVLSHPLLKATFFDRWRIKKPRYVDNAIKYLDENLSDGQRVYLYTYDQNSNYNWGYFSQSPLFSFLINKPVLGPWLSTFPNELSNNLYKPVDEIIKTGGDESITNFLSYLGVKYLVLMKDIAFLEKKDFDFVEKEFQKQNNVSFVKNFSQWDIFENQNPLPLFVFYKNLVSVPNVDGFLEIIGSENKTDLYCIECENSQNIIKRYRLRPNDFIQNEKGVGNFSFEVDKETKLRFSIKKIKNFSKLPEIYLDEDKLILRDAGQGFVVGEKLISAGKHTVKLKLPVFGVNLIKNGDFSKTLSDWDFFEEGTYYDLPIKSSLEEYGTGKVKLQAINKTIVMSQAVSQLKKNTKYRLRFTFKSLEKLPLQIGISSQQKEAVKFIVDPEYHKFYSDKKTTREIIFQPDISAIFVNFYTKVLSVKQNRQIISDISLSEASDINYIDIIPKTEKFEKISFGKISPVEYKLDFSSSNSGWLNFNMTCSSEWLAVENGKKLEHLCTNGFANGYFIPSAGNHRIKIYYQPHKIFVRSTVFSIGFLLLLFIVSLFRR